MKGMAMFSASMTPCQIFYNMKFLLLKFMKMQYAIYDDEIYEELYVNQKPIHQNISFNCDSALFKQNIALFHNVPDLIQFLTTLTKYFSPKYNYAAINNK